jgi:hypothetical protein
VSAVPSADDIRAGYEALRTQAMGGRPVDEPRGLALVLTRGLPAWVRAWAVPPVGGAASAHVAPTPVPAADRRVATEGIGGEVVRVLTEMVLGAKGAIV